MNCHDEFNFAESRFVLITVSFSEKRSLFQK